MRADDIRYGLKVLIVKGFFRGSKGKVRATTGGKDPAFSVELEDGCYVSMMEPTEFTHYPPHLECPE